MKSIKVLAVLLAVIFFTNLAQADEPVRLSLFVAATTLKQADEFIVTVRLIAGGEEINAVEGVLEVPLSQLEVREVRDANSALSFWVVRPEVGTDGRVRFSGLAPGGFAGQGELFAVVLRAQEPGTANLSLTGIKVLRNDGLATPVLTATAVLPIQIGPRPSSLRPLEVPAISDIVPPQQFTPRLGRDPSVFGGRWFVAFATRDNDTGLARYEVLETDNPAAAANPTTVWQVAQSPYELKDQRLKQHILVRATDKAGNSWVATVVRPPAAQWYEKGSFWGIIISAVALVLVVWLGLRLMTSRQRPNVPENTP